MITKTRRLARAFLYGAWTAFSALTAACGDAATPETGGITTGQDAPDSGTARSGNGSTSGSLGNAGTGSSGSRGTSGNNASANASGASANASGASGGASSASANGSTANGGGSVDGDAGELSVDGAVTSGLPDSGSVDASSDASDAMDAGGTMGDASSTDAGATVHYGTSVLPILNASCQGCHGSSGGLTISYNSIVNVKSQQMPRLNYVTPNDAGRSYLWCKVNPTDTDCAKAGTTITGRRMPQGAPSLSAANLTTIKTWILQGAVHN